MPTNQTSTDPMLSIRKNPQGIMFKVFVQPRSSRNRIVGLHGDSLKLKLTAPPVDGAANKMCVKFLAKRLAVSPSSLEIISGHNSRRKTILLKSRQTPPSPVEYARLKQQLEQLAD
jgi:uncharacterized protein (TIGR00251 family)